MCTVENWRIILRKKFQITMNTFGVFFQYVPYIILSFSSETILNTQFCVLLKPLILL